MAWAICADVDYEGNSYVDVMFTNISLFLFGLVVWPLVVGILYLVKLYKCFVNELKDTKYP